MCLILLLVFVICLSLCLYDKAAPPKACSAKYSLGSEVIQPTVAPTVVDYSTDPLQLAGPQILHQQSDHTHQVTTSFKHAPI